MPGQIMRKQIPADKTTDVVEFSKMNPAQRLHSITAGLDVREITITIYMFFIYPFFQVLQYGQSEYVRAFGMNVTPTPISVPARVIAPPTLRYGPGSGELTIVRCFVVKYWVLVDGLVYLTETLQRAVEYVSTLLTER
jgi:eukaryotic translation initiation factor 2C